MFVLREREDLCIPHVVQCCYHRLWGTDNSDDIFLLVYCIDVTHIILYKYSSHNVSTCQLYMNESLHSEYSGVACMCQEGAQGSGYS